MVTLFWRFVSIPFSAVLPEQTNGAAFPVMMKPLSFSVMPGAPNLI
jgi:hypothetical protein